MKYTKKLLAVAVLSAIVSTATAQVEAVATQAIPSMPVSKPGQCHALVNVPAKLGDKVEEVVVRESGEELEIIPAEFEWVEKQIVVKEETKSYEIIPATYKEEVEQVLVEPEDVKSEVIPAVYESEDKTIVVRPAMQVWSKARSGASALNNEVMRLIEVPEEVKVIKEEKMVTPPQVKEETVDAVYMEVVKQVVDQPASVREIIIPAEYKTVRVKELVKEAQQVRKPIEKEFETITKQEVLEPAKLNWQRVPCDADLTEDNLKIMQRGLRQAGYDVSVDGKFGKGSLSALEDYQQKKGLATGAITIETMQSLGVDIE